jgi:PIN domain nuclease of toxin-antitoxin system
MDSVILDSSALLALINKEPGFDAVREVLPNAVMSSVNVAEVAGILMARYNMSKHETGTIINELIKGVIAFNTEQAFLTGTIETISRKNKLGLSLGDRACLALAESLNIPIYTADRAWSKLKILNIKINLIR